MQGSARAGFRDPKPGKFQNETRNPARNPDLKILNPEPGPEKFLDPEPSPEPGFPGRVEKPGATRKIFGLFLQSIVRFVTYHLLHIQRAEKVSTYRRKKFITT